MHDYCERFTPFTAGRPALMQNFLYFANRRFLIHANRNGSGLRTFTLTNTSNAVAVDFDVR